MIIWYNILFVLFFTVGLPLTVPVVLASKKRRKTVLQRLGLAPLHKRMQKKSPYSPDKKPIWVHALSVGEVISSVPLVKEVKKLYRDRKIVFSVSTKTGFEIADKLLKENVNGLFFFPYDFIFSVKRIIGKVDPAVVIMVETDIWPNFLFEMKKRNVPVVLVNARLSKKSFSGYRKLLFFTKPVFTTFSKICAQTAEDASRFSLLGVPKEKIKTTGNLKFDQTYEPVPGKKIENLRRSMNICPGQKVLLAGSTHKGEESILTDAFLRAKKDFPDLLLVIAPRDPERAGYVCKIFESAGFYSVLMKNVQKTGPDKKVDVIVVDTIGILRNLYALAEIAFVGGSLVKSGGHNPLEPAAFSKPVIFGRDMSNFSQISDMLVQSDGAIQVDDADGIYRTCAMLLKDGIKAQKIGENAFKVFCSNRGAAAKTLTVIEAVIPAQAGLI